MKIMKICAVLSGAVLASALFSDVEAAPITFSNLSPTAINIPDFVPGAPDPIILSVEVPDIGTVTDVNVTVFGIDHPRLFDLEIYLQGPGGETVVLLDDAGDFFNSPVGGVDLTFDDEASGPVPDPGPIVSGSVTPSGFDGDVAIDADPTILGLSDPNDLLDSLSVFDGTNVAGVYTLFVLDSIPTPSNFVGSFDGFSITFETTDVPDPTDLSSPGALALLLPGLAALCLAKRRRRR